MQLPQGINYAYKSSTCAKEAHARKWIGQCFGKLSIPKMATFTGTALLSPKSSTLTPRKLPLASAASPATEVTGGFWHLVRHLFLFVN